MMDFLGKAQLLWTLLVAIGVALVALHQQRQTPKHTLFNVEWPPYHSSGSARANPKPSAGTELNPSLSDIP